ncbi:MAG: glycosyltransferase family 2 protein [Spirochaetaceae bacterium]|nr:glycosyltransferase family 2 protein [Spirochaetaceae bacterium]
MNNNVKISVCVPVYATEAVLKNCLCSIAGQNFDSFEIIIVDDCSPGVKDLKLTVESIVKEVQKEFPALSIKLVKHKKNRSLLEARRTGFINSCGDFITFVDSDDELLPNALSFMYENAIKNQADFVHCNSQITFKDDEKDFIKQDIVNKVEEVYGGILVNSDIMSSFMFKSEKSHNGFVWAKLYSRELVNQVFNEVPMMYCTLGEDLCLSFFFNLFAKKYVGLPQTKVYKYNYATGITSYHKNISIKQFEHSCSVSTVFTVLFSYVNDLLQTCQSKDEEQTILMYKKVLQEKCINFAKNNILMLDNSVPKENYQECRDVLLEYWGEDIFKILQN